MTSTERHQAVVDYGFTQREARFLVLVMRHAGLCVKRQYAAFAGIANGGDRCNALFDKLVRRGFAAAVDCIHNRARLFHVHHKPLYHAIGEADNRYRRAVPARAAAERLMRLDAALISPELDWLTTRSEKFAHVAARTALQSSEPSAELPGQDRLEQFPGTSPMQLPRIFLGDTRHAHHAPHPPIPEQIPRQEVQQPGQVQLIRLRAPRTPIHLNA